jgi:hypothetical protein
LVVEIYGATHMQESYNVYYLYNEAFWRKEALREQRKKPGLGLYSG